MADDSPGDAEMSGDASSSPGDAFLHIYVVDRTDEADVTPGECSWFVACARSIQEAISLAPDDGFGPTRSLVTHWGIAINGASPGMLRASYKAG